MGTSASFARKALLCLAAALLAFTLVPANAFAQGESAQPQDAVGSQAGETQEAGSDQIDEGSGSTSAVSPTEGGTLASALVGTPTAFVNSDVALDGEPVVGSFTVDGLTFVVTEGSDVELVGVSSDWQQVTSSQEGDGSPVAPMLASGSDGLAGDSSALAIPESISYAGTDYAVTSIGAYAFYLSGVTAAELPATMTDVDDRAFRSSDVSSVSVADGNASYSSFDGALYDADRSSLLLIPEGKQGTVLLPKRAEVADAGKFSHCSLASAIAVEEGSAAFASENGLLFDASLTTLLRVPAGATDIVIRDGCTAIAAGAMEACASLATITAPASVTSISPDVFTSVPTVSLPAASAVADDPGASTGATDGSSEQAGPTPASSSATTQITAMVALSSTDDDLPEVDSASIKACLSEGADDAAWLAIGFSAEERFGIQSSASKGIEDGPSATTQMSLVAQASASEMWLCSPGTIYTYDTSNTSIRAEQIDTYRSVYYAGHIIHDYRYDGGTLWCDYTGSRTYYGAYGLSPDMKGVDSVEYSYDGVNWHPLGSSWTRLTGIVYVSLNGARDRYPVALDSQGAKDSGTDQITPINYQAMPSIVLPKKNGWFFCGYWTQPDGQGECFYAADGSSARDAFFTEASTLYAYWKEADCDLSFDVDSEPGDEDYPGEAKDDQTVSGSQIEAGEKVEIADPKRPGYVFQGWVIPNVDGTEAIDQDLVYKDGTDGKWYVDASKLPDYANDEGRVELTARWTSVISVDVPSAVTFYADVVTQGNESREGAASSAFGQNKVASQSEVDLRIVGLESAAVATQGSTLGADSILKKSSSATPSSSTQKLFSLYPTDKALTPDDLQDPDAVSTTKPADAVDFALDDLLLEKSFAADAFTIPAGDTLNLGYRLNLAETGTELDYDALATLDEGQSASIANISYTFAHEASLGPMPSGSMTDPLWFENLDDGLGAIGIYGLSDIKMAAEDLSAHSDDPTQSPYYELYSSLVGSAVFHLKVDDSYLDTCLLGICQDFKKDGGKAGLTFQLNDVYAYQNAKSTAAGGGSFACAINAASTSSGGWLLSEMRDRLRTTFMNSLESGLQPLIVQVRKNQQEAGGADASKLQSTEDETIWLPSMYEVYGATFSNFNESEQYSKEGYEPFQYQAYAGSNGSSINGKAIKRFNGSAVHWWLRSAYRGVTTNFCRIAANGAGTSLTAASTTGVAPAFCL